MDVECPNGLDLVPEKLQTPWGMLSGREEIKNATTNAEFPNIFDEGGAAVTALDERGDECA